MTTTIYFYSENNNDVEIASIQYPGYPCFLVGDKITLEVKNNVPSEWDVKVLESTEWEIISIKHNALKYYGSRVRFQLSQYVTLKAIS